MSLSLLTLAACGGDDDASEPSGESAPTETLYGIQTMTFTDTSRSTFVALLPNLDVKQTVALGSAREFPEYSPTDAFEGGLIVANGERPELTRYTISQANEWTQGDTINFSQFTSTPVEAAIYASAEKAYVGFDKTNHVRFNPTTFAILGETGASPAIPLTRDGFMVWRGNNYVVAGNFFFQPYYWADNTYEKYAPISQINVIDTATDQVKAPIDVPCPHLHITSKDDEGNTYFSNGQGSIPVAVVDPAAPRNCFARVNAGQDTLDPSSVVEFRTLTEGREGSNLFYIGNGRALFNVYHHERDNFGPNPDLDLLDFSTSYHIWTLDLNTRKAAMLEGVEFAGGQFLTFRIDGKVLVAIPKGDYSSTAVYEMTADGKAEKRFDVEGWTTKIYRIR